VPVCARAEEEGVPRVFASVFAHQSQEPWGELDDEAATRRALGAAVGHSCSPQGTHGCVYFNAQLQESEGSFKIVLGPPEIGLSYRFSRVYGSEALIRLNVSPKTVDSKNKRAQKGGGVIKFLSGKSFKIFHKTFQAFAVKDDTVLLIDTTSATSLFDAIDWHNPVYLNRHQPSAKWAARFHLGFSTTEPALLIPPENVFFWDDFDMRTQATRPCKTLTPNHIRWQIEGFEIGKAAYKPNNDRWVWLREYCGPQVVAKHLSMEAPPERYPISLRRSEGMCLDM